MALAALALLATLTLFAAAVRTQDPDDPVTAEDGRHSTIAPYLWATGMEGTVSFEGTPDLPVDVPFSTIWDTLDMAFSLHFEGRKDRCGFGSDGMYFKVAADQSFNIPIGPGEGIEGEIGGEIGLELQETLPEGFGFCRLTVTDRSTNPGLADTFVGFRYVEAKQEVTAARLDLPQPGAQLDRRRRRNARLRPPSATSSVSWLAAISPSAPVSRGPSRGVLGSEVYKMKHSGPELNTQREFIRCEPL